MKRILFIGLLILSMGGISSAQIQSSRLQIHAKMEYEMYSSSAHYNPYFQILAVCDIGNGTMIYITRVAGTEGISSSTVKDGCNKER